MITFKAKTPSGEIIKSKLAPFSFPAGEAHTKIEDRREHEPTEIAIIQPSATSLHDDLFQLAMWDNTLTNTFHYLEPKRVVLMPYMPGARADRGVPFGLQVYADFIHELDIDQIILFDPHSEATVRELNSGSIDITVLGSDIIPTNNFKYFNQNYDGVIAPDAGAKDRAQEFADVISCEVFTVEKTRDFETGKLLGFEVPELDPKGRYLIVDDLCDRGGSFIGIAEKTGLGRGQLDLFVSHGVFSKDALETIPEKFGSIYTTNSYAPERDLPANFTRYDIIRPMLDAIL